MATTRHWSLAVIDLFGAFQREVTHWPAHEAIVATVLLDAFLAADPEARRQIMPYADHLDPAHVNILLDAMRTISIEEAHEPTPHRDRGRPARH